MGELGYPGHIGELGYPGHLGTRTFRTHRRPIDSGSSYSSSSDCSVIDAEPVQLNEKLPRQ